MNPQHLSDAALITGFAAFWVFLISYVVALLMRRYWAGAIFGIGAVMATMTLGNWMLAIAWGILAGIAVAFALTWDKENR